MVTGAGSGIGKAIAVRFLAEGAKVVAVDIDKSALGALGSQLGRSVLTLHGDVTAEANMQSICARTVREMGRLDVVVANAGRGGYAPIADLDVAEFRAIVDLCLTGVFLTIKSTAKVMSDGGSIITIASINALQPSAGMSAYCAAKAGVAMLTQVAAMELGERRIRVNAIAPGLIETAATEGFFAVPEIVDEFVENTTVKRFGSPDDVARLAVFLASDESTFVSGSMYPVDGGALTGRYPRLADAIGPIPPS